MKKTLSILLALVMVISVFPVFADDAKAADETKATEVVKTTQPVVTAEEAGKVLSEYGAIKGDQNGNLMADKELTRAQSTVVLARLMNKEEEAKIFAGETTFADVQDPKNEDYCGDYYVSYIAYAAKQGWIEGRDKETFAPNNAVTVQEFSVMMLRALGHTEYVGADKWKEVPEVAKKMGLWTGVNAQPSDKLIRGNAFVIMHNTLETVAKNSSLALKYDLKYVDANQAMTLKAPAADKLEVTFNEAVDTDDVTLAVTKENKEVKIDKITWNKEKTVATIKLVAKMRKGEYVVTATSKADDSKMTASYTAENQGIGEIVILNDKALTTKGELKNSKPAVKPGLKDGDTGAFAYVYYDIYDQYGNSIKESTSIQWTASADIYRDERSLGRLLVRRSDGKAFTYGEKLYVTGVYVKNGMSKAVELTIGQEQNLHGVDVKGFVEKGTAKLLDKLPVGFKSGQYYMVYSITDQNGNQMDPIDKPVEKSHVTFVSEAMLLIEKLETGGDNESLVTIDGIEYNAIMVKPGMKVKEGGDVTIKAIANNTGNQTTFDTSVGMEKILTEFTMASPSEIVVDGENVMIPFTALDQNGDEITDFDTIAKNKTFNKLSFSASEGTLKLYEKNDGTAALRYIDKNVKWADSQATDGLSRTVSLTSIIIGGNTSNVILSIEDKARPEAIVDGGLDEYVVENFSKALKLNDFKYLDQYGRDMNKLYDDGKISEESTSTHNSKVYSISDNGFFAAARGGNVLKGQDFKDHDFGVRVTFSGETGYFYGTKAVTNTTPNYSTDATLTQKDELRLSLNGYEVAVIKAKAPTDMVKSSKAGFSLKYEVYSLEKDKVFTADAQAVSSYKSKNLTLLDVSVLKGFEFKNLPAKAWIETIKSNDYAGENGSYPLTNKNISNPVSGTFAPTATYVLDFNDGKDIVVTGKFNGKVVEVPSFYLAVGSKALQQASSDYYNYTSSTDITGVKAADVTTADVVKLTKANKKLKWSDFYNATAAKYVRRDFNDVVTARVYGFKKATNEATAETAFLVDTAVKSMLVSDAAPRADKIVALEKWSINPAKTQLGNNTAHDPVKRVAHTNKSKLKNFQYFVIDQYAKGYTKDTPAYRFTNVVENANGYAKNNFVTNSNNTKEAYVVGAERGDTFDTVITVGNVNLTVPSTVGADACAYISNEDNFYRKDLIGKDGALEKQRLEGLK